MTTIRDREYVPFVPDLDCAWEFTITPKAESISGVYDEILSITETVFESVAGFVRPTEVTATVLGYDRNLPVMDAFEIDPAFQTVVEAMSDSGVTYQSLLTNLQAVAPPSDRVTTLRLVDFPCEETKITFDDRTEWISRNSSRYRWQLRERPVDEQPAQDLFSIKINHLRYVTREESYYHISIWTSTDIWFKDTDLGRRNRPRLERMLSTLVEELNPDKIEVYSDTFDEERLLNFLPE